MKNNLFFAAIIFLSCTTKNSTPSNLEIDPQLTGIDLQLNAEEVPRLESQVTTGASLYKGTMDPSIPIWLYLNEQEHPCGGDMTIIDAMYSYDQEKWILLDVTTDQQKKNYCFVEVNFSGALFLAASKNELNGTWISPDAKKQLNVTLEKISLDASTNEKMQETLYDDLLYNENDC